MTREEKKLLKIIQETIDDFPRTVREKKRRAEYRKAFAKKTFGPLVRQLRRDLAKRSNGGFK